VRTVGFFYLKFGIVALLDGGVQSSLNLDILDGKLCAVGREAHVAVGNEVRVNKLGDKSTVGIKEKVISYNTGDDLHFSSGGILISIV
jgi:hypothetical protein